MLHQPKVKDGLKNDWNQFIKNCKFCNNKKKQPWLAPAKVDQPHAAHTAFWTDTRADTVTQVEIVLAQSNSKHTLPIHISHLRPSFQNEIEFLMKYPWK